MTEFDESLALVRVAEKEWTGRADPRREASTGMFGGWTSALLLKAVQSDAVDAGSPVSLSVHFVNAVIPGSALTVRTRSLGGSRALSTWQAELLPEGAEGLAAVATVVLAKRRETFGFTDAVMPEAPPPDGLPQLHPPGTFGQRSRFQRFTAFRSSTAPTPGRCSGCARPPVARSTWSSSPTSRTTFRRAAGRGGPSPGRTPPSPCPCTSTRPMPSSRAWATTTCCSTSRARGPSVHRRRPRAYLEPWRRAAGDDRAARMVPVSEGSPARPTRDRESERTLAGIALVLGAVACFAVLDTAAKISTAAVPILMAIWFRYAFQAVATTLVLLPRHGAALLRTEHPRFQLLRGSLLLASSVLAFLSLRYMPLAEFTSVVLIAPLVVTLFAATVLKEEVSTLRWALVAGGFVGTLVILRPGGTVFSWAILLPLGLVVTNAWFQVLTSRLARTEKPMTIHFYSGWVGTLIASLALPFVWTALPGWQVVGPAVPDGIHGRCRPLPPDPRLPARARIDAYALPLCPDRLRHGRRLAHVPAGAGRRRRWSASVLIAVCGAAGAWLTVRERKEPIEPAES